MLLTKHNGRRKQLKRGTEGVDCSMTELRSPDSLSSLTDSEEDGVVFSASVACCAQSFIILMMSIYLIFLFQAVKLLSAHTDATVFI